MLSGSVEPRKRRLLKWLPALKLAFLSATAGFMDVIDTGSKLTDLEKKHDKLLDELDSLNAMLEQALRDASGKPPAENTENSDGSKDLTFDGPDGHSC